MTVRHVTSGVDEGSLISFNEPIFYTGTGGSEPRVIKTSGPSIVDRYGPNETLGANMESPPRERIALAKERKPWAGGLDKTLLKRAKDIIDGFNHHGVMEAAIDLESLRGIVLQLWESATNGTQFHQEILATLESAILSVESPNESQLSVFKEAVMDLEMDVLTQAHVDVIRRRFIAEGFSPLALLSEVEDVDDGG